MPRTSSHRRPHLFLVVKGSGKPGRCRHCRQAVVWAIAVTRKGAKTLPFNAAPAYAPEVRAANDVRYEQWSSELLHVVTCTRYSAGRSQ